MKEIFRQKWFIVDRSFWCKGLFPNFFNVYKCGVIFKWRSTIWGYTCLSCVVILIDPHNEKQKYNGVTCEMARSNIYSPLALGLVLEACRQKWEKYFLQIVCVYLSECQIQNSW